MLDENQELLGMVFLDDIRPMMFEQKLYETVKVYDVMKSATSIIFYNDKTEKVMQKFKESGAWNLPVLKNKKYIGFISKSKLLNAYRNKLIQVTS